MACKTNPGPSSLPPTKDGSLPPRVVLRVGWRPLRALLCTERRVTGGGGVSDYTAKSLTLKLTAFLLVAFLGSRCVSHRRKTGRYTHSWLALDAMVMVVVVAGGDRLAGTTSVSIR